MTELLAIGSGSLVGFTLGLIGGGGSILATPLLLYVVGITQPHVAIGTGAFAVSMSAFANFLGHWRAGNVRWGNALVFAAFGVAGALLGSTLGKAFDGQKLLFLFAILMATIGVLMLRAKPCTGSPIQDDGVGIKRSFSIRLAAVALAVGTLSGFFGIGGGFLIVPGLLFATGMPMIAAVGTSLLAVGALGLATALNYALSGMIDWPVALQYILGGLVGGWLGTMLACRLAAYKGLLTRIFAGLIFAVAFYMLYRTGSAWAARA